MLNQLLHTPEGVRDIYGKEFQIKKSVETKLMNTVHLYGYEEIQTPVFEYSDVFSNDIGTTSAKELFKFFDKDGNTLVLRPDFTPSIARCAAKYFCERRDPLRFCYHGNTFSNVSNLQGKWKEVTQLGAELLNDSSVEADAEMIYLVVRSLLDCGLQRFQVSIGEVEYFKGLCEEAGLDEATELDLRSCISGKNYFATQELLAEREVAEPFKSRLLKVADMFGEMCSLKEAKEMVHNPRSLNAIERLEKIYEVLKEYGVENYVSFDLGMLSKYHYYTGMIFRAYTYGVGEAIVKGGRYDRLLPKFGKEAPAVGFAVVMDTLLEALSRQKVTVEIPEKPVVITYRQDEYAVKLKEAETLRAQGIAVAMICEER